MEIVSRERSVAELTSKRASQVQDTARVRRMNEIETKNTSDGDEVFLQTPSSRSLGASIGRRDEHGVLSVDDFVAAESSPEGNRPTHGAKVKRGQLNAVAQGRYGTGPAPYGYRRGNPGEKPLVVDDREAEVVRIIFREYLHTRSTGKVVQYLHAKNIFTRKGNKWSRQAIAIILSNRTYRGRVSYDEVEAQGVHDAIIEPALFYKANSIRERKRRRKDDEDQRESSPNGDEAIESFE